MHSLFRTTLAASSLIITLVLAGGISLAATQDNPGTLQTPKTTEGITAEVVKARAYTSQLVVLANKSFPSGSEKFNQAFKLYANAYSKYSAWDAYVTSALRQGHGKHLNNNKEYDEIAESASTSATNFISYVESNTTGESHAVVAIISSLADLGLKLWTGISKQLADQRNAAANAFSNDTKWQTWTEITGGSAAKTGTSSPTLPDNKK